MIAKRYSCFPIGELKWDILQHRASSLKAVQRLLLLLGSLALAIVLVQVARWTHCDRPQAPVDASPSFAQSVTQSRDTHFRVAHKRAVDATAAQSVLARGTRQRSARALSRLDTSISRTIAASKQQAELRADAANQPGGQRRRLAPRPGQLSTLRASGRLSI